MNTKICTFNIRYDTKDDGINCLDGRKPLIEEVLGREDFDIIGFQEVLPHVRTWLLSSLKGYTLVGIGREGNRDGEGTPIAFKSDKFMLESFDSFWLSPVPDVPGSRFPTDQSGCPRICSFAMLVSCETHKRLRVYNTHLDHVGERARAQGMAVVLERMDADALKYPDVPAVLMGDFNATPDSPFLSDIPMAKDGMINVTDMLDFTFHGYMNQPKVKIDYIYTSAPCDKSATRALINVCDGIYLSDHYPVCTEIEV